jgi:hypothetical protein
MRIGRQRRAVPEVPVLGLPAHVFVAALAAGFVTCSAGDPVQGLPPTAPAATQRAAPNAQGETAQPGHAARPAAPSQATDAATLDRALHDPSTVTRLEVIWLLPSRGDIAVPQRVSMLLGALEREISTPTSEQPVAGSYMSASTSIRMEIARTLGTLDSGVVPLLRYEITGKTGEPREWAILAAGFAHSPDLAPQLRELLRSSADGGVRAMAASLLGEMAIREAIPDLRAALSDSYQVTFEVADLGITRTLFPVREDAAAALEALGVTVQRLKGGVFVADGVR